MEKKTIWQCHNPECNAQYGEYVNGCPKCSTGEPGGSHKVSIFNEHHPAYNKSMEKKCNCHEPYDAEKSDGGYPRCPVHDVLQEKKYPIVGDLIKWVEALVYYSQIYTVKGVRAANMPNHETAWKEAQKWLWDNCKADEFGNYHLKEPPTGPVWVKATTWPEDHNMVHWRRASDKKPLLIVGRNYQGNIIAQFGRVYTPEELEWLEEHPE